MEAGAEARAFFSPGPAWLQNWNVRLPPRSRASHSKALSTLRKSFIDAVKGNFFFVAGFYIQDIQIKNQAVNKFSPTALPARISDGLSLPTLAMALVIVPQEEEQREGSRHCHCHCHCCYHPDEASWTLSTPFLLVNRPGREQPAEEEPLRTRAHNSVTHGVQRVFEITRHPAINYSP